MARFIFQVRRTLSFTLIWSIVFLLLTYTIGFVPILNRVVLFETVYLLEIVFAMIATFIAINYFTYGSWNDNHTGTSETMM